MDAFVKDFQLMYERIKYERREQREILKSREVEEKRLKRTKRSKKGRKIDYVKERILREKERLVNS